jgi:hypothetical protein
MQNNKKLSTKHIALAACFAALYAFFCFFPIFQIVGLPNKSITMAAIIAPVIGMFVGPYLGALSTTLGGAIGFFVGPFSLPSFVSGVIAAFSAGTLHFGKRSLCAFTYFSLLLLFGFYPFVGPVWLYPQLLWFQLIGFVILISPIWSIVVRNMWSSKNNATLIFAVFMISLISTLAGQIAGSLTFEAFSWPIFVADVNAWRLNWQIIAWIYPVERIIISLAAAFISVTLHKVLKSANLTKMLTDANLQKKEHP